MTPGRDTCLGVIFRHKFPVISNFVNAQMRYAFLHGINLRRVWSFRDSAGERGTGVQKYLLIAAGGALGSVARYWLTSVISNRLGFRFPYGTLAVNISSCLVIGFVMTWFGERLELHAGYRFLVAVGFIGAYSTFSTYEWETLSTLRSGAFALATVYALGSLALGLSATWCGSVLAEFL